MSERLDRVKATKLPIPRSQNLVPHGLMNAIASRTCCKQAWPTVVRTSVTRWRVDPPVIGDRRQCAHWVRQASGSLGAGQGWSTHV
jgi:hypothetical protein